MPGILASPAWRDSGVLFITFDEAAGLERQADRVATLVIAQSGLGLACLALGCQADTLGEFVR